ncbi:MAG: hypothetical protein ACI37N_04680 [Prevotella sp.]
MQQKFAIFDRFIQLVNQHYCQQHQKTVLKISEDLNFPNPAFFCKYFKRLTAMTPLEYRGKE